MKVTQLQKVKKAIHMTSFYFKNFWYNRSGDFLVSVWGRRRKFYMAMAHCVVLVRGVFTISAYTFPIYETVSILGRNCRIL